MEETWVRAGQVVKVPTDKELGRVYELYNAYGQAQNGVTLEDFVECGASINQKAAATRE